MKKLLTVHEVSQRINVSPDTIRRWEKKGLIKANRSKNNYRLFDFEEVDLHYKKINGIISGRGFCVLKDEKTDLRAIDLFAGGGGTALGLENAGLHHDLLVEKDRHAAATLKMNRPNWNVFEGDVAEVDYTPFAGKVDVVEGGFPCQAFSYAGNKMGFKDVRGTMFFEFARCVKDVRPSIAIGENVRGLVNHDNGRTLKLMASILKDLGYKVAYKILRAQYLDVPQKRERIMIIGVRNDLDIPILFPRERNYTVSLREALGGCPVSEGAKYPEKKKTVLDLVPPGGYWRDLPDSIQKEYMGASYHLGGGKTGMARRMSWDEPSLTLTCSPAQKQTERCHPDETRPFTVREYARIQTFPDEWEFSGSIAAQYKQIGNAVPVNLGYYFGKAVRAMLLNEKREEFIGVDG